MARYKPNNSMRDGLGGFMMDPSKTGRIALIVARKVQAEAAADVRARTGGSKDDDGEHLADKYRVEAITTVLNERPPNPRRAAAVINDARHAAVDEFGRRPGHKDAHHSLRRAGAKYGELRGDIG